MLNNRNQPMFSKMARATAKAAGHPIGFTIAMMLIVVWAASGPVFKFSDTWQLVINTGTTIVTFLMVFLIQNTQNRDSEAVHVKLDELIKANRNANNAVLDLDCLNEHQLAELQEQYRKLAASGRDLITQTGKKTGN